MVQRPIRRLVVIILISVLLFSGCSSTLRIYTIAEEHPGYYLVRDKDNIAYKYDTKTHELSPYGGTLTEPLKLIEEYTAPHNLVHSTLNKYTGTYADAMSYCNFLLNKGFNLKRVDLTPSTIDIVLRRETEKVRVLYLEGTSVRIFYKDNSSKNQFPPYINSKENNDESDS